jgi:CMP-N,N'-diacetyllegionaminic acid synthase
MPKILGLINARGGSKGVPGKNTKLLLGRPLIAWSVETANNCPSIDRVVVSTEDEKIANAARDAGADVPFMRPSALAGDDVLQIDVIIHAVEFLEKQGESYDYICLLQPTCPVRAVEDVEGALKLLVSSGADSVITVTPTPHHPMTLYSKGEGQKLTQFIETSKAGVTRQQFPEMFWRTGSVYAFRRENLKARSMYGSDLRGYEVPASRCTNIDDPLDWDIAELLLKKHLEGV